MVKVSTRTLLLILTLSVHFFYGQITVEKKTQFGFAQLDFISIQMPEVNEPNMDFTGVHYNAMINDWSYAGLGFYGAVGGIRGGFFTLGLNLGIKKEIYKQIYVDAGLHFGGGGGAAAPDGGGAFILPHLNLGYDFSYFSVSGGWSYINFFDGGKIQSSQIYAAVQIPLNFNYTEFNKRQLKIDLDNIKSSEWQNQSHRISTTVHLNNLFVKGNSTFTNGASIRGRTINLAGFEFSSFINDDWFYFIKADGAYSGIPAGYMDIFIGGGYHLSMNKNRTNIQAKLGVGAGGGGGVDTKGGFLVSPDISIEHNIFDNLYLTINKGYMMSPDRHFYSSTLGFGLKYYVDKDGISLKNISQKKLVIKGVQTILQQEWYANASRNGGFTQDMHQISLQINVFLNKYIYGVGQTSFANFGDAGAYAEGIIGLGIQTKSFMKHRLSIFAQILGGAAGGGGISTGEGLIVKPSTGINLKLTKTLDLRSGFGYVKAKGGKLANFYANLGLSYNISFLTSK